MSEETPKKPEAILEPAVTAHAELDATLLDHGTRIVQLERAAAAAEARYRRALIEVGLATPVVLEAIRLIVQAFQG